MSTFYDRLKIQANSAERGTDRNHVTVRRSDLAELLHHFERLDSEARARHAAAEVQYQQLKEANELLTADQGDRNWSFKL